MSQKVYQIITDKIIEKLEAGEVPWHRPWIGGGHPTVLLAMQNHGSPYWMSFRQAGKLGGRIKKGQKGAAIVFWKWIDADKDLDEDGKPKRVPLLRYYLVWNLEQTEGIDPKKIPGSDKGIDFEPIDRCEAVVAGMPKRPEVKHGGGRAYYDPKKDFVGMPPQKSFDSEAMYYNVLFHELGHSTGHEGRVARKSLSDWAPFGSENYSKEELVAEMAAAFLSGHCGIERLTIDNSAAYIKNWLKRLKDDVKLVVHAAAQAQKASDFILNIAHETS